MLNGKAQKRGQRKDGRDREKPYLQKGVAYDNFGTNRVSLVTFPSFIIIY